MYHGLLCLALHQPVLLLILLSLRLCSLPQVLERVTGLQEVLADERRLDQELLSRIGLKLHSLSFCTFLLEFLFLLVVLQQLHLLRD